MLQVDQPKSADDLMAHYKRLKQRAASRPAPQAPPPPEKPAWSQVAAKPPALPWISDTARRIAQDVAAKHSVDVNAMLSKSRTPRLVQARQAMMWRLRNETTWSLPRIGRLMGIDHSTVCHGVNAHRRRLLAQAALSRSASK